MTSLISQREGIPFLAVIEASMMEITFEILREAGIRMPRAIGGTISIVFGVVIGPAAVEAGIVSNIMFIVVALTTIASFVIPIYTFAVAGRLLRFFFLLLGAILGLYGFLIRKNIKATINTLQEKYQADIFGLGEQYRVPGLSKL